MNTLKKKLNKNGGFTLVEMLIVVAIIAILIAVSIPLVNSALERSRDATDQANERAAKAEAAIYVLLHDDYAESSPELAVYNALIGTGAFYDAASGELLAAKNNITNKYGKCTDCGSTTYENAGDHDGKVIKIQYQVTDQAAGEDGTGAIAAGTYTITWE